jgi:hypothetical protein
MAQENAIASELEPAVKRLQELEKEVASVSVPLSYTGELYHLRLHIHLIAEKLASRSVKPVSDT